ncbi:Hypothetical Protein PANA_1138 [Pantoea ananatis LMG 20103]|uniref:Uncharacterized protein n=1 Tax=Pantoea ananatis (strain LMG 20103) TaxID=706191 RepID=D4GMH0_PANAM|nr:Hypothetical Protein PANA_1138 [Pantoea ananatis LMG 20103]
MRLRRIFRNFYVNLDDTTAVSHGNFELVTIDVDAFAARRQVTKALHHQSTDGIHFIVAELGAKYLVEIFNRGKCANGISLTVELADITIFFIVIFVFDFAHDQFQNIFNRDQPGHTTKLIDHNRHMIALGAKLFQHAVNALALRDHDRRTQDFFHAERLRFAAHKRQQIFRHQDPFNVVFVFADDRKAGVRGIDNHAEALFQVLITFQRNHLGAGDHDVTHALFCNIQHALEHVPGILINQIFFDWSHGSGPVARHGF